MIALPTKMTFLGKSVDLNLVKNFSWAGDSCNAVLHNILELYKQTYTKYISFPSMRKRTCDNRLYNLYDSV